MNYIINNRIIILILFIVVITLITAKPIFWENLPAANQATKNNISTPAIEKLTALKYKNNQYGFTFSLPESWVGYTIVAQSWEGRSIDGQDSQIVNGPEIFIRHPLWTASLPRQDIPIIIFTYAQWDLIEQEKLSLGAAPIGPSELGRNANYIFALPARYNYAFPVGFEEVDQIIQSRALRAF